MESRGGPASAGIAHFSPHPPDPLTSQLRSALWPFTIRRSEKQIPGRRPIWRAVREDNRGQTAGDCAQERGDEDVKHGP